jgi:hypothetical protein
MRRQVASMEASMSVGSQMGTVGRTVSDVDQQLEQEEQDKQNHERIRDDAMKKIVSVKTSRFDCT